MADEQWKMEEFCCTLLLSLLELDFNLWEAGTRAAGRTNPGSVQYNLRKLRVLHTNNIPPKTNCNDGMVVD